MRRAWLAAVGLAITAQATLAFDLQGHRGARGLHPENTIAAFEAAIVLGVTTLETDLALTQDGHLVLTHDPLLNPDIVRGEDGRWVEAGRAVWQMPLAALQRFDVGRLRPGSRYAEQWTLQTPRDGARMPTFEQLAALVKGAGRPVRINIETKLSPAKPDETASPDAFAAAVVAAVRRHKLEPRTTVQSFDWRTLRLVQDMAPEIATACLTIETERTNNVRPPPGAPSWTAGLRVETFGNSVPRLVRAAGCTTWSPFWRNVDATALAEAKASGLRVVPWTVNTAEYMRALIALGVDGLITDYPDRARDVLGLLGKQPD